MIDRMIVYLLSVSAETLECCFTLYRNKDGRQAEQPGVIGLMDASRGRAPATIDSVRFLAIIVPDMNKISPTTRVEEILTKYPSLSRTFIELGMPCLVCGEPFWGTIAELSKQYGANSAELIEKLNQKVWEIDERS